MPRQSKENLLTVSEAAKLIRVSPDTIRRWRREGKLKKCSKDSSNGYWYYSEGELIQQRSFIR